MHLPSEIAELLLEWAQLRAEMEKLHCQFKAAHDQSVEVRLQSAKTRAGSLLHELQSRMKAQGSKSRRCNPSAAVGERPRNYDKTSPNFQSWKISWNPYHAFSPTVNHSVPRHGYLTDDFESVPKIKRKFAKDFFFAEASARLSKGCNDVQELLRHLETRSPRFPEEDVE